MILDGQMIPAWFANPAYLVALIAFARARPKRSGTAPRRPRTRSDAQIFAVVLGGIALVLCADWFRMAVAEGDLADLLPGYYVWSLAFATGVVAFVRGHAAPPPLRS